MIDSYTVTLILFDEEKIPYNPQFIFIDEQEAMSLMRIFINQGYSAMITIDYAD